MEINTLGSKVKVWLHSLVASQCSAAVAHELQEEAQQPPPLEIIPPTGTALVSEN